MTKLRQHLTSDVQGTYTWTHVPEDLTTREERLAPWMPLDGLAQEWASFGQDTVSVERSLAISHAFAALSAEQQALREYERREEQPHVSSQEPWLERSFGSEPCLAWLQEAATQWGHAARVLSEVSRTPTEQEELRQGRLSALQERLRVTTISLSVLTEQVRSEASCPSGAGSARKEVLPWH